ncbi:hypothetical protein SODALDRAFT_322705 [Sodiomyces alkalinus F11]|uniref:NACHT domain-containing protein n=1 Tax=Sodiomyces alkalinus (strain CBS 110278 / VKM F-3762 / F11) TaxID=1314773 RepID=A0A3N2Q4I2_SODAK|nr:hypothetical protein SODALDRAFT_322705 [Sodiomyces alkalinus F11]ROT41607.1 hypothetical protein SODALDRAFT_322705 [Sodiomyces alkalinus F11]
MALVGALKVILSLNLSPSTAAGAIDALAEKTPEQSKSSPADDTFDLAVVNDQTNARIRIACRNEQDVGRSSGWSKADLPRGTGTSRDLTLSYHGKIDLKLKRAIFVVADVTFRPFEPQYAHFLDKIKYHYGILAVEQALIQTKLLLRTHEQQVEAVKKAEQRQVEWDKRYHELSQLWTARERADEIRIKRWLNPPDDQHINDALDKCDRDRIEGTAQWILNGAQFMSWIAHSVASDGDGFENILWVKDNPDVLNAFSFAVKLSRQTYALEAELVGLFQLVANQLPRLVLILDALDESNNPEGLATSVASVLHRTKAKAIVFSRPNIRVLQNQLKSSLRHIHLTRKKVDWDVQRLLQIRLGQLGPDIFPASCSMSWAVSHLGDRASGMISWAKLMVDYLGLLPDATAREEAHKELTPHEELVDVYIRILKLISGKTSIERDIAKRVFLYLTYPDRHLDARELWEVTLHWNRPSDSPGRRNCLSPTSSELEWFHSAILIRCGSLVEKRSPGYGFVHQSVLDFFWNGLDSKNTKCQDPDVAQFLARSAECHKQIAMDCITYLSTRLPSAPLSGDNAIRTISWPIHLNESVISVKQTSPSRYSHFLESYVELATLLSKFAFNKFGIMTWIELYYTVARDIRHLDALEDWCAAVEPVSQVLPRQFRDASTTMSCLHADLKLLNSHWGKTLEAKPFEIWGDISKYFESQFLQKTAVVDIYPLGPFSPNDSSLSSKPLAMISLPMAIGATFVVLGRAYFLDSESSAAVTDDTRVQQSWHLPAPTPRTDPRLAFTHSYQISDDGRDILRQELKCLTTVPSDDPIMFGLSVLRKDDLRQRYTLLGQFGSPGTMVQLRHCSFHPSLPFLTTTFGGPQITTPIYQEALRAAEDCHLGSETAGPGWSMQLARAEEGGALVHLAHGGLELGRPLSVGSGTCRLALSKRSSRTTLEVVQSDDSAIVNQHLLSFPDSWQGIDSSVYASVESSTAKENPVDISINTSSKAWYDSGQPEGVKPMLARKNLAAMQMPETTVLRHGRGPGLKRSADMIEDELCRLYESNKNFGGIPVVVFCGDFNAFDKECRTGRTWSC